MTKIYFHNLDDEAEIIRPGKVVTSSHTYLYESCHISKKKLGTVARSVELWHILSGKFFPLPLIQEEQVVSYWQKNGHSILVNACGRLAQEQCGQVTDRPNMTSAVYRGCKASNQTNKHISKTFNHCGPHI